MEPEGSLPHSQERYVISTGKYLLICQRNAVRLSGSFDRKEDDSTLLRNVGNYLPFDMAQNSKRPDLKRGNTFPSICCLTQH
jgi:hypothetical protein